MTMLTDALDLLLKRSQFFFRLLLEHLQISLTAVFIAIAAGLFIGIVMSEWRKFQA